MWLLIFSILFRRTARAVFLLLGLMIVITVVYFANNFEQWKSDCVARHDDPAFVARNNCP